MSENLNQLTIGLDARSIHCSTRRGTGKNLIDLYTHVLNANPGWKVIAYHRGENEQGIDHPNYIPRKIEIPGDRINAWFRLRLPFAAKVDHLDLMHFPANLCPGWLPTPTLVTIHDLLPLGAGGSLAKSFKATLKTVAQRKLHVVTPSAFTGRQLSQQFGIASDHITVNHWAPDTAMKKIDDPVEHRLLTYRYGIKRPYLLHLGAPDARKNTARVIEAFSYLPPRIRKQVQLLVIGIDNEDAAEQFKRQAKSQGISSDDIMIHGFAEEEDMSALYSFANALIYPSLGEGFGLPIVDAFITDTPILTSQTTSLPEIAGNAALFVDPTSVSQITQSMQQLIQNDALRDRLTQRGHERAAMFSWEATSNRFVRAVKNTLRLKEVRRAA